MHRMRRRRGRATMQAGLPGRVHRPQSGLDREQGRPARQVSTIARMSWPMSFTNRICQRLHEEHDGTVALMERLDQLIARHRHQPPEAKESDVARLLSDLWSALETEVERHFAFEEERLFAYLSAIGERAIGAHLTEEHTAIRP